MNHVLLFWLDCAMKTTAVLALCAVAAFAARRTAAAIRHLIWLAGLVIAICPPGFPSPGARHCTFSRALARQADNLDPAGVPYCGK